MHSTIVRELISKYKNSEELILLNAYSRGTDPKVDMSIDKKPAIDKYLRQRIEEKVVFKDAVVGLKDILLSEELEEDL